MSMDALQAQLHCNDMLQTVMVSGSGQEVMHLTHKHHSLCLYALDPGTDFV